MRTEWVDFKKVKEGVDIQMVLDHYGVKGLAKSGQELRGPCPVHKGSQRSKNFTVNVSKNAFKCFSSDCGARGNVLDFVAAMERCSVRDAALKLQEWFEIGDTSASSPGQSEGTDEATEVSRGIYSNQDGALFEVITTATSAEDFERFVVYRELFGDYEFWVAPIQNFSAAVGLSVPARLTLVKTL
jgi:CHC2-type zinc finger protein/uncharacterized protein DUF1653